MILALYMSAPLSLWPPLQDPSFDISSTVSPSAYPYETNPWRRLSISHEAPKVRYSGSSEAPIRTIFSLSISHIS